MPTHSSPAPQVDPMTTLQNRWYNGLVGQLLLSPALFQINQPSPPIAPSDGGLWAYQNVIPPVSLTFNHGLCSGDLFFDEYAAVASQMQHPASAFEQDLGKANYQGWSAYVKHQSPPPAANQLPTLFQQWAMVYAPSVAAVGVADLTEMVLISTAQQALLPYQGPNAQPADFTGTYAQLLQTLGQASGESLTFDSSATSDDVGNTWTGGTNVGVDGLWAGCCSPSRLSRKFAASTVTISAQFKRYVVWTSTPGSWYNSSLLNTAYSSQATPPWPKNANPTWDDVFGPDGSMQRLIASLVVVDGMHATVTADAIYCTTDQQTIFNKASRGLWPFYTPTNSGTVTNVVTFDNVTGMKIETVTQPGNPLVIGANVLSVAQYLGHTATMTSGVKRA